MICVFGGQTEGQRPRYYARRTDPIGQTGANGGYLPHRIVPFIYAGEEVMRDKEGCITVAKSGLSQRHRLET